MIIHHAVRQRRGTTVVAVGIERVPAAGHLAQSHSAVCRPIAAQVVSALDAGDHRNHSNESFDFLERWAEGLRRGAGALRVSGLR